VLSPERQSARMSDTKNGRLGLYGAEHSKCNQMMTLGFKGLAGKCACYSLGSQLPVTVIQWAVSLSWVENACSRPLFGGRF